ncbi:MAG TPA: SPOR domain-containing protein [Steroidobacteraceae bacterium]|nr:SPOR domain-containing protein [Steroidobacteraceae bacterium]
MRRSNIRQLFSASLCALFGGLFAANVGAQVSAIGPTRVVEFIDVSELDTHVDINIQFSCSLAYITHAPSSQGGEIRIRLRVGPNCGISPTARIPSELPPVSGGAGIISAATVDSDLPSQLTLTITFKKSEKFVLVQGADTRGLRLRLVDHNFRAGSVAVGAPPAVTTYFAINLESQPKPFDPSAIEIAKQRLNVPVFISEAEVDDQKWYRLRAGPVRTREEADRFLQLALNTYPRAWIAMGEDATTTKSSVVVPESALPAVQTIGSDPPLDADTLTRLMKEARAATSARNYPKAIQLLTQLQRQPEFPQRSQAQELLGLARERSGQLAHAKAEYQEYLQRYPDGEAAERVQMRLRILRIASMQAHSGTATTTSDQAWQVNGGFSQMFRYDGLQVENTVPAQTSSTVPTTQSTNQNALFNDVDMLARRKGERFDFMSRVSAGYAKAFSSDSLGSQTRVTTASIQMSDSVTRVLARLGRQSRNSDGVLGTFDGLFVSYQWRPSWAINTSVGFPVEQTNFTPNTNRRFESVAVAFIPPGAHWDASVFGITQQFEGVRDRQAVGLEARYLDAGRSLIGYFDYDTAFQSLNAAVLLGSVLLPAKWNLSFDLEKRNSPILTTRNALIGQDVTTIAELQQFFTLDEIMQFARDRTPISSNYALSASRPLGERFQFSATVAATEIGATVASAGVDAQPATGLQLSYQMQFYGSNLWKSRDFNVLNLLYTDTQTGKLASLGVTSRLPFRGAWRVGPRLTVNRRVLATDNSTEMTYIPAMLIDYQRDRKLLQFEFGGQLGKRDALDQTQNTKRYYVSLGYRIGF